MAYKWIKMRTKLLTDSRTIRIASKLKVDRRLVCGCLLELWAFADENVGDDGFVEGFTFETVDILLRMPGFAEAMPKDWLIARDGGVEFPNYVEHNGSSARTRAMNALRQAKKRAETSGSDDVDTDDAHLSDNSHAHTVTDDAQERDDSNADTVTRREENRGEEEKNIPPSAEAPEGASRDSVSKPPKRKKDPWVTDKWEGYIECTEEEVVAGQVCSFLNGKAREFSEEIVEEALKKVKRYIAPADLGGTWNKFKTLDDLNRYFVGICKGIKDRRRSPNAKVAAIETSDVQDAQWGAVGS